MTARTSADQCTWGMPSHFDDQSPAPNRRDKKREEFESEIGTRYGNDMIGLTWSAIPPKVLEYPLPCKISAELQYPSPSAVSAWVDTHEP